MTVKRRSAPPLTGVRTKFCKEAKEALTLSIIGLFCCAIILCPMAISKANNAKQQIRANPSLDGNGVATAAIVIAAGGLVLWAVSLLSQFGGAGM
jgi:hypothetical protein